MGGGGGGGGGSRGAFEPLQRYLVQDTLIESSL